MRRNIKAILMAAVLKNVSNVIRMIRGEISTSALVKQGLTIGNNFSRQGG